MDDVLVDTLNKVHCPNEGIDVAVALAERFFAKGLQRLFRRMVRLGVVVAHGRDLEAI